MELVSTDTLNATGGSHWAGGGGRLVLWAGCCRYFSLVHHGCQSCNRVSLDKLCLHRAGAREGRRGRHPPHFFLHQVLQRSRVLGVSAANCARRRSPCLQIIGIKLDGLSASPASSLAIRMPALWLLEFLGHTMLRGSILAAMTLAGSTLNDAVAWSNVPYTVFVLQGILQNRPAKHGVNIAGQYLILAISAFIMHTCFTVINSRYGNP